MLISVIIPCLNEEHNISALLRLLNTARLHYNGVVEVIVVDGGSTDRTCEIVEQCDGVQLVHSRKGRAIQMNTGASHCSGDVLYFVHADSRPPITCFAKIAHHVKQGSTLGGFSFEFDSPKVLLKINNWFTRLNLISVRGGDQTIFIQRSLFDRLAGFCESWTIMEEYDLLKRAKGIGEQYTLMKGSTLVSARKYDSKSWLRVQLANLQAMIMWHYGCSPAYIRERYVKALNLNPDLAR